MLSLREAEATKQSVSRQADCHEFKNSRNDEMKTETALRIEAASFFKILNSSLRGVCDEVICLFIYRLPQQIKKLVSQ
jgi:hypothetical protein